MATAKFAANGLENQPASSHAGDEASSVLKDNFARLQTRAWVFLYLESFFLACLLAAIAGALPVVMLLRG